MKQKVIIGESVYETSEVYGMEKIDENSDCVICLSDPVNTIVKPCNHACICEQCANELLKSKTPCPICRGGNI